MRCDLGRFVRMGIIGLSLSLAFVACRSEDAGQSGKGRQNQKEETVPSRCGPADLPQALETGSWDPRFTVAGFTGHDGLFPVVMDLAVDEEGHLLAGGRFQWVEGKAVEPLVRLEDGAWKPARNTWERELPPGGISALATGPGGVLALATFDRSTSGVWEHSYRGEIWLDRGAAGLEMIGGFDGAVRRMEWVGDTLWVAGIFQLEGNSETSGLALWNGTAWTAPPGGPANGAVYALHTDGERVWAGGFFSEIGGIQATRLAEWDGSQWIPHDIDLPLTVILAIATDGDELYVGGGLALEENPRGERKGGVVRQVPGGWELLGGGVAAYDDDGRVNDLLVHDGSLYVSGCFSHLGGAFLDPEAIPGHSIARWRNESWEALDDSAGVSTVWFDPSFCGDEYEYASWDGLYQRLLAHDGKIVMAGGFAGVAGLPAQGLAFFDPATDTWSPPSKTGLGFSGEVADLAVAGTSCSVYAMGHFSHGGDVPTPSGVARYVAGGWQPVGGPRPPGHSYCTRLVVDEDENVFLGCWTDFQPGETSRARILRWDGSTWQAVGEPHGLEAIHDMALDPAGRLWIAGGSETGWVARLEGDEFVVVEDGFDGLVYRLAFARTKPKHVSDFPLVVAGNFFQVGSMEARRIALWTGEAWKALGEGLSTDVVAVAQVGGRIYASTQMIDEQQMILGEWDGERWTDIATPANGLPAPHGETVHTFTRLLEHDGLLLATGYVWPEGGARNAYVYDGKQFRSVSGGADAISVNAVAVTPTGLWLGGSIAVVVGDEGRLPSVGIARLGWEAAPR